jgi:hypothetical protein
MIMKRNLCLTPLLAAGLFFSAQSQVVDKGDKLFGGSFSFTIFNLNSVGNSNNEGDNVGLKPSFCMDAEKGSCDRVERKYRIFKKQK